MLARIFRKLLLHYYIRRMDDKRYFIKLLRLINVEELRPTRDELKRLKIKSYFRTIKEYNDFLMDELLQFRFDDILPKKLLRVEKKKVNYFDFFIEDRSLVDYRTELKLFINAYIELTFLVEEVDINSSGILFFNSKVINKYLANMEEILKTIISSIDI